MKTIRVSDVVTLMEQLAPPVLAEEWDNCGLQVGSTQWPVQRIWVALDPLPEVLQAAARQRVNMLITHHPLLIRPLRAIDVETPTGKIIDVALANKIALYAAHTNLDCAQDGVNDALAHAFDLKVFAPMIPVKGLEEDQGGPQVSGMGRLGRLDKELTLEALARRVKEKLNLNIIKVSGDPGMKVDQVAVCSGSGSSLLDVFLQGPAQVYISGDLRYHDARRVEDQGRALIDIGHFASEHLVIDPLVCKLNTAARSSQWQIDIEACRLERDPFFFVTDGKIS